MCAQSPVCLGSWKLSNLLPGASIARAFQGSWRAGNRSGPNLSDARIRGFESEERYKRSPRLEPVPFAYRVAS